jgi:trans-aconitate methyltransferase
MAVEPVRAGAHWLALREPADADARSTALVDELLSRVPAGAVTVVHDLGSGTGSMLRWLSSRLPEPQHWVLHDRDAELLELALGGSPCDRERMSVETRHGDLTRLRPEALGDATLLTASALLDMMTADELGRLVDLCARVGRPVLVALSVTGEVTLTPSDPLDRQVRDAFNAHQRRDRGQGRLLGPDAVTEAVASLDRRGFDVRTQPSPWRLGPAHPSLTQAWLEGWVGAACEQEPDLAGPAAPYVERRLAELASGRLALTVGHQDLLALPPHDLRSWP